MVNKNLIKFVKTARNRGFGDSQIKEILIQHNWPVNEIDLAFASLQPKVKFKNQVTIYLDSDILKALEKRANKNMFTITEQIEDILRRSVINCKKSTKSEKLDDMFIGLFSRKQSSKRKN